MVMVLWKRAGIKCLGSDLQCKLWEEVWICLGRILVNHNCIGLVLFEGKKDLTSKIHQ